MTRHRMVLGSTIALLLVAGEIGCMKRKETLTVARDGGVRIQLEYEADSRDEFYGGDAMPSEESGWKTDLVVETEQEDKETYKLAAEASFGPGAALPATYASPSDPLADLMLRFPTRVIREERPDGIYYHFHRVYPRRDWAQVETLRGMLLDDNVKAISEKDAAEVTHDDRVTLVKALAGAAIVNIATFSRAAFLDVTPDAPQDGWLRAEEGLKAMREGLDYERLATLMENPDKETADRALAAEAEAFESNALGVVVSALAAGGYDGRRMARFHERFNWHKRNYEVTADLADDAFEILVELPGEIVATDMLAHIEGNAVEWEFDGQWFRDRDLELMATSRVARE